MAGPINIFYTIPIFKPSTGERYMQLIPKPLYDHVLEVYRKTPKTQRLELHQDKDNLIINTKNKSHAKTKK